MASAIRLAGRVEHIASGVRSTLKEPAVREMLGAQAARAAARCNALCSEQMRRAGARYEHSTVERGYTAAGIVYCGGDEDGKFARIDNFRNNTLKKGCGI